MEELSIEQKAKRYDEALARAREIHSEGKSQCHNVMTKVFPELKESEDEQHRKWILEYLYDGLRKSDEQFKKQFKCAISWLEKQGEKSQGKSAIEAIKEEKVDNANKVNPRFEVGDWITDGNSVLHITSMDRGFYQFENSYDAISIIDKKYHLWTIDDVKDGDVLAEVSCIFIIQKLGDNSTASKTYCTLYDDGDFDNGSILYFDIDSTKPATKKQCGQLEKAMFDAGYEWDAEKKELKKIEDEPENYKKQVMSEMTDLVKDYIQQKPTWSEEDENSLLDALWCCKKVASIAKDENEMGTVWCAERWLNSLKDRYTWKPTKEQINAIRLARSFVTDDFSENPTLSEILLDLEKQLKKITEG